MDTGRQEQPLNAITSPIVDQIETIVREVPGWSPVDQLLTLFNLAYINKDIPGDIVEIGSWCGRSAVVLGMAARLLGNAKVHGIDLFPEKDDWKQNPDGSYSFQVRLNGSLLGGYQNQTVWKEPFEKDIAPIYQKHNSLLDLFRETISRNHLQDYVTPFRGTSTQFLNSAPENFRCRLAFIDGDHCYDAVCMDIRNVERILSPGGWICFDDAFSYYDDVNRAIQDGIIDNPSFELCQQMTRKFFVARKKATR